MRSSSLFKGVIKNIDTVLTGGLAVKFTVFRKYWQVVITCLILLCLSPFSFALNCAGDYKVSQLELIKIKQELQKVTSKVQYEASVKSRYDFVDSMLAVSSICVQEDGLEQDMVSNWKQLQAVLSELQGSAQAAAFAKFNNWMTAKEGDLHSLDSELFLIGT